MTLLLQQPLLLAAACVCMLLCGLAAHGHAAVWTIAAAVAVSAMIVAGLACMLPYEELLVLLLPSLLVCLAVTLWEGRA